MQITSGSTVIKKPSNRFNNRDFKQLNSLAEIKGYKVSERTKSIIINDNKLKLRKINGKIYAGTKDLSSMMRSKRQMFEWDPKKNN